MLPRSSDPPDYGLFDVDAAALLNLFPVLGRVLGDGAANRTDGAKPEIIYRPALGTVVTLGPLPGGDPPIDLAKPGPGRFRLTATQWGLPTVNNVSVGPTTSGGSRGQALDPAQAAALAALIRPTAADRPGQAWGRPSTRSFSASDRWRRAAMRASAASQALQAAGLARDDTARIQAIIDSSANTTANTTAVPVLPAGTYHISSALRLGGHGYLVGAGADKTFIFALGPQMAMIEGNGAGGSYSFKLAGVSLSGGAYGIWMREATFGLHTQVTGSWISDVLFTNFSKAGMFMDDIYGLDNNLFSHLVFENCTIGFLQYAPQSQRVPGSTQCKQAWDNKNLDYMDKTVFYRNRYIGSGTMTPSSNF